MLSELMVPLDGGEFAEQAVPIAAALARQVGARLHLVSAYRFPTGEAQALISMGIGGPASTEPDSRDRLAGRLRDLVLTTAATYEIPVCGSLLDTGDAVADQLVRFSETHGIDLIVMATHARGPVGRVLLGSVAHRLVQASHRPCLLIRGPTEVPPLDGTPVFARILVPLDGSADAEYILEQVHDLCDPKSTEIVVLRVTPPPILLEPLLGAAPVIPPAAPVPAFPKFTRDYVEGIAAALRGGGLRARGLALEQPNIAATILSVAEAEEADLIALSAHSRSGRDRYFTGSVIDQVVHASAVPVLVRRLTAAPSGTIAAARTPVGS